MLASNLNQLLEVTSGVATSYKIGKSLEQRLTGKFYTHARIGQAMAADIADRIDRADRLKIIDPFCGDGRLIVWLIEALAERRKLPLLALSISLWDCDETAVELASASIRALLNRMEITNAVIEARAGDSFASALECTKQYDICITNPPWETLKPDPRELAGLNLEEKEAYVALLKQKVIGLEKSYPHSRPSKKFSGWGANLARCGIEVSVQITRTEGHFGIVAPASIFGDQISAPLRIWLFENNLLDKIHHYPAEAKLFEGVDQSAVYFVGHRCEDKSAAINPNIELVQHSEGDSDSRPPRLKLSAPTLASTAYAIGFTSSPEITSALTYLSALPMLSTYEAGPEVLFKLGRELDETGIASKLTPAGTFRFAKGRQISRYAEITGDPLFLAPGITPPQSCSVSRLVWRDVARQSSARRVIATIVPPGVVTGNSLNVLVPTRNSTHHLPALLGIFNSIIFEAQVRASISTNHLSVGAIRKIRVPNLQDADFSMRVAALVNRQLENPTAENAAAIDFEVARWYGIPEDVYLGLLTNLEEHNPDEVAEIRKIVMVHRVKGQNIKHEIANHYAAALSELDLRICRSVPPGGNWKDIPEDIPSERIKNIRISFAKGEGSRSTYYGRLHPDRPSYTINTYFTRPGNGCHIHYDFAGNQHRTLSHREAARLQSFPDDFTFKGSKGSIATQIGNAVPPLLAYQVATHLKIVGQTVDLFAGAGGLGKGFAWAGWETLVGNELEASFAETYQANVHPDIVVGDITDHSVQQTILARIAKVRDRSQPLCVLGGPPCQGFSTAGNKRSMEDSRNWLFRDYCRLLEAVRPDVFVFENVTGLLNMEGGRVFEMVKGELSKHAKRLIVWKLHSENYAIPQRRSRVIIVGDNTGKVPESPPKIISTLADSDLVSNLPMPPSVKEALDDLPPLTPGSDSGDSGYRHAAASAYQELMRGGISAAEYLKRVTQ